MIAGRCTKAQKAIFKLHSALTMTYNVSKKLALSIFDEHIFPKLKYGCAIWGQTFNIDTVSVTLASPKKLNKEDLTKLFQSVTGKNICFEIIRT